MVKWCELCEIGIAKHKCLCGFCETTHLLCQKCYEEAKEEGTIIDRNFKKKDINKELRKKLK